MSKKIRLAVFASGGGSNAQVIMRYFAKHPHIEVGLVVAENEKAGVIEKAKTANVKCAVLATGQWKDTDFIISLLQQNTIDYIVLAGWLKLMPAQLVSLYPNRIFNIHPSLLPKFGGKGMYGIHVHEAVLAAKETETGITIHLIDNEYDKGRILFQATTKITYPLTAEDLQKQVLQLEHAHYAAVIEREVSRQVAP